MITTCAARGAFFLLLLPVVAASQDRDMRPSPSSLPRSSFLWNQAQLEVGLGNWDAVFPGRLVPNGSRVSALSSGPPIVRLAPGTPGGAELERFIVEQRTAGLLILHRGAVRLERYALGHSPAGKWTSQSVAKSVTSTLVGVAVKEGFIRSIDDPVSAYLPGLRGSAYDDVSIRQLMTMTSGVRWTEDYTDLRSDIARFYVAPVDSGLSATVSYMRKLPREAPPGTKWAYKTGETHLIGRVVAAATKMPLAEYLSTRIWAPYGMEQPASWTLDRTRDELAGCCLQAALRDYARFGQLVLDDGRIDGRSIVPAGWFADATRRHFETTYPGRGYGYQWWITDDGTANAIGIHGQLVHIDRGWQLVVVINSAWPEATSAARTAARLRLLDLIAGAIDAEGPR